MKQFSGTMKYLLSGNSKANTARFIAPSRYEMEELRRSFKYACSKRTALQLGIFGASQYNTIGLVSITQKTATFFL